MNQALDTHRTRQVFHLHTPTGSVSLRDVKATFHDFASAEGVLRSGYGGTAVLGGIIPFAGGDSRCSMYLGEPGARPAAMRKPSTNPLGCRFEFDIEYNDMEVSRYFGLMESSLDLLTADSSPLKKIVVSRSERLRFECDLAAEELYERINYLYPFANNYYVQYLDQDDSCFMGASPELFLKKRGDTILTEPLAGTLLKDPQLDPVADKTNAEHVLRQDKYVDEHQHLVEFMMTGLSKFCSEVAAPHEPAVVDAPGVWHIGTPISAVLKNPDVMISDLISELHPSPAVCGVPKSLAREMITTTESPRGYYGGLVGWVDTSGDCEFYMALRGLELNNHSKYVNLRAGGGIVSSSSIATEYAETVAKLGTMRRVLGVSKGGELIPCDVEVERRLVPNFANVEETS